MRNRALSFPIVSVVLLASLTAVRAADEDEDRRIRSRGLLWGWGHSWTPGWPGWRKTETDIAFVAFHPQMGWFVTDRLELYGEGSILLYHLPTFEVSAGILGLAGRHHFRKRGRFLPYVTLGGGLIWTSLEAPEIDRTFNFQVILGAGVRVRRASGPGILVEFRNHHISNAGTAGENLGVNAATLLVGLDWILR
jgi:lipid A 3-O-deacylase